MKFLVRTELLLNSELSGLKIGFSFKISSRMGKNFDQNGFAKGLRPFAQEEGFKGRRTDSPLPLVELFAEGGTD